MDDDRIYNLGPIFGAFSSGADDRVSLLCINCANPHGRIRGLEIIIFMLHTS